MYENAPTRSLLRLSYPGSSTILQRPEKSQAAIGISHRMMLTRKLIPLATVLCLAQLRAQQAPMPHAIWIEPASEQVSSTQNAPLPLFRHTFVVPDTPTSATLRVSGLGQYEAHINGLNITSAVLTPGWTLYTKHVLFDTYDVTKFLHAGNNAIGILLGNGMYNVLPDPGRYSKFTRSFGPPKLIAELTLHFNGRPDLVVASGQDWTTSPGPITFSNVYGGEDFDARLEPAGWDTPTFDDSAWEHTISVSGPGGALIPETTPPIKALEIFSPVKINPLRPNVTVYDLGQNFSGWPEIAVTGPRGATIKLLAGELLAPSGDVTQRSANASPDDPNLFTYTLRGNATAAHPEQWHPRFSTYGFRYVQAETSSPDVSILRLDGRFLHDDVRRVGTFTSSDSLFNRIHALIDNAMLSNMVSILTDCPHREKLGWLEQTHLAATSLNYNWDLSTLYNKISDDMADSQQPDGLVPSIAPEYPVFPGAFRDSPEWGSAVILSPWVAYQFSGDPQSLRTHYDSMQRYAAYLAGKSSNNLLDYGLGDWYDIGPGEPGPSKLTSLGLTASAIYYQDLTTLARIATITGHARDAATYSAQAEAVKLAFNERFLHPETHLYDRGSQTAQAMPLAVGLVPDDQQQAVLASLVATIRAAQNHVTAGDIGFHYLVRALTDYGRSDVLFDMLSRTDPPSYGAQLAAGATSLTEAWDANPNDSQNHFMLGHAEEWFYRALAGIDFDRSRTRTEQLHIAPAIVGNLISASATFSSSLGLIKSAWQRSSPGSPTLTMDVTIPAGASAKVIFPSVYSWKIAVDRDLLKSSLQDQRIQTAPTNGGQAYAYLRSGQYRFTLQRKP
jgi:alpha-L-rhamnosidase